jgi:hypothetical protein
MDLFPPRASPSMKRRWRITDSSRAICSRSVYSCQSRNRVIEVGADRTRTTALALVPVEVEVDPLHRVSEGEKDHRDRGGNQMWKERMRRDIGREGRRYLRRTRTRLGVHEAVSGGMSRETVLASGEELVSEGLVGGVLVRTERGMGLGGNGVGARKRGTGGRAGAGDERCSRQATVRMAPGVEDKGAGQWARSNRYQADSAGCAVCSLRRDAACA